MTELVPHILPEDFRSEPNPDHESLVKTLWFKGDGLALCSAKRKRCRKCKREFQPDERDLDFCPACGEHRPCRTVVEIAGMRCRVHGGSGPIGASASNFKHGRYSKYMPTRLRAKYIEAQNDPELLVLRNEIAVLDAHIADRLSTVDVGGSARLFSRAREAFIGFRDALDRNDAETMRIHLQTLDRVLMQATGEYAGWEDIRASLEQRRKLVDTEIRRLEKLKHIVTAEELQTFLHAVAAIAKRVIKDQPTLHEFVREILELGARGASGNPR